ncbi:unnamed protein product [Trichobilharzia regenti]|nr:unnamed protein product [Trichobilharzia regenti]
MNSVQAYHSLHELRSAIHSWSNEMMINWREREFSGTYEEALEISGLIQNTRNHYLSCWYKTDQLVGIQSQIVSLSLGSKFPPEKSKLLCNCQLHEITVTPEDEIYPQKRLSNTRWLSDIAVNHDEGCSTSQANWKSPIQLNTTTTNSVSAAATFTTDKNKKPTFFCRLFNKQKSKQKINSNNQKASHATRKHSKWLKQVNMPELCMLSAETDEKFQSSLYEVQCTLYDTWLFDDSIIEKFIKCMPVKWCENQQDLYSFLIITEDLFSVKVESTSEFQEFLHETRLLRLALIDLSNAGSGQQYNCDNVLRPVSGELIWKSLSGYINNSVQNTNFMKTSFSSSLFRRSSQYFRRFESDGSFVEKKLDLNNNTRIKSPNSEINLAGNNIWRS